MNPYTLAAQAALDKRRRQQVLRIAGLGCGLVLAVFGTLGVLVLMLAGWLMSPFVGGAPAPPGQATVLNVYRADEEQAIQAYCPRVATTVTYIDSKGKKAQKVVMECSGVPLTFVQAIMTQESGGWAEAISSAGALGLMQVTIGKFDLSNTASNTAPLDPKTNIDAGVRYLESLWSMYPNNLQLIAAAYNAGPGAVNAWVAAYGTTDWTKIAAHQSVQTFAKGQTFHYVSAVMAYYSEYNNGMSSTQATK